MAIKDAYGKGAHNERALKKILEDLGFFVVRAGHSGSDGTSPDLIALKSTRKFGLECKAVNAANLYIEKPKFVHYQEWEKRTGVQVFIAWRPNRKEWRFFPLEILRETDAAFALSQKDLAMGLTVENLST